MRRRAWPAQSPAPHRARRSRRAVSREALFLAGDVLAIILIEPAAEEAAAVDQIQLFARSIWVAGSVGVRNQFGHRSGGGRFGQGGAVGVEAAQDMVLLAVGLDDDRLWRRPFDLALRPEAERRL